VIIVKQALKKYTSINIKATYQDWDVSTTYMFGDIVFSEQYYYRSVVDNNTGEIPVKDSPRWLLWSISNRYAQIDLHAGTETVWSPLTALAPTDNALITVFPSNSNNVVALGKVSAKDVTIVVKDASGVIQQTQTNGSYPRPNANTWYNYYFDAFQIVGNSESFYFNIVPIQGGSIEVRATADDSGEAKVGFMVVGNSLHVGDSLFNISTAIEDNSIWDTDGFGISTVSEREASESLDIDVQYPSTNTNKVKIMVRDIVGKIVLFIGDEQANSRYDHLMILGKVDSFTPVISNPVVTKASFQISEVL